MRRLKRNVTELRRAHAILKAARPSSEPSSTAFPGDRGLHREHADHREAVGLRWGGAPMPICRVRRLLATSHHR